MLDVVATGDDARLIPLAQQAGDVLGGRERGITGPRRGQGIEAVEVTLVIEDLILRSGLPDVSLFFGRSVDHATVVALGHLPFPDQLEIIELIDGDDIAE